MCKDMDFYHLQKSLDLNMVKKIVNKEISASKKIKTITKKFNESKYGKGFKKEGLKIGKKSGQQVSDKIIPAAADLTGLKIADKIMSLKISDKEPKEEIQEKQETIILPEKRQQTIDDVENR